MALPDFFNFGVLKIMFKWENDNLQNNIQGPIMQGPRYINSLSSILHIYIGTHGQSHWEMNYALGNMNHKYEAWGIHSCSSYLDEVYTNNKMFILQWNNLMARWKENKRHYGCPPKFGCTWSYYARGTTFATTYGIKMNCYMMGVGNTLGMRDHAKIILGTHSEYNGNKKKGGCHLPM
jgi:hypothetical protein